MSDVKALADIITMIEGLEAAIEARDYEAAACAERAVLQAVLALIASGCAQPEAVARAGLRVQALKFPRWW